jgi:hypothetical protein
MKLRNLIIAGASAVVIPIAVLSACANTISAGDDPPTGPGPSFVDPEAGSITEDAGMCNAYDCPAPYTTCTDKPGKCNTNLKTDFQNCGACGNSCILEDAGRLVNGFLSCIDGKCRSYCPSGVGDCNGNFEDGCEVNLETDRQNCGACGNACKDGEVCWKYACGCPPGFTQCGDSCTRVEIDTDNCGACGTKCEMPNPGDPNVDAGAWTCDGGVIPEHYGPICSNSKCDVGCSDGYGDCNNDPCSDGCETYLGNDPKNCGACGNACLPGQGCVLGKCECEDPDLKFCAGQCVDVLSNAGHCGACGNICPGYAGSNMQAGRAVCVLGRCSFSCPPGRADCDQRIENGCEVDTYADPLNCGGCGVQCDVDGGQPCIEGQCHTKPCELPDGGGPF